MPTKLNLTDRKASAAAQLTKGQTFYTAAGKAQQAAQTAQKPLLRANQACVESTAAAGIYDEVDKTQDQLIAAGIDPATFYAGMLTNADRLVAAASADNAEAQRIADGSDSPGTPG